MGLLKLKNDEIHVWRIPLGQRNTVFQNFNQLSQSEQIKADKFRRRSDRLAYCQAHLAKRNILSRYIGQTPQSIVFQSNLFGKPSISKHLPEKTLIFPSFSRVKLPVFKAA